MTRWIVLMLVAATAPASAQEADRRLPWHERSRPFLLVDAPRRFAPDDPARLRVQLRGGGRVAIGVFRVLRPEALLDVAGERQGTTVAQAPLGAEAERLWEQTSPLPRQGRRLRLVARRVEEMPKPIERRSVSAAQESVVHDENEDEDDVATYWVQNDPWSTRTVDLGRLPPGAYLVRAHAGAWAATAVISVGDLVLLARRGDLHDTLLVTDGDGQPLSGVPVEARIGEAVAHRGTTDDDGLARLPGSDALDVRFVARRGDDVAWADVTHARLSPCDPRVYLATGRPTYRRAEVVHVRGHVRGCDADGRFVPLPDEPVAAWPGLEGERVATRTDADGNFTVELSAEGRLGAEVRGHPHERTIRIDDRALPRRAVTVEVDRPWATVGDTVRVEVADDDGGWPRARDVVLTTPTGRLLARIGPSQPARFVVPVDLPAGEPFGRFPLSASVLDGGFVTMAATELWVARTPTLVALHAAATVGVEGGATRVSVRITDPLGSPVPGQVEVSVHGADPNGNRVSGPARATRTLSVDREGRAVADLPLSGRGPWIVVAQHGGARSEQVVWTRPRPPQLAARGPLAVAPRAERVPPGGELVASVRVPAGAGRAWVTLEQGSLWSSRLVGAGVHEVRLRVPARSRGMASLVVTHVRGGRVETATAAVEVVTSREVAVTVETDRSTYGPGTDAAVTIRAATSDGAPSDGVASLWLADAGYWELGDETYPLPGPYHRLPGRLASPGDSTRPRGYGAEEGRVLPDARMELDGRRLPGTTYRHAWRHHGRLIRVELRGKLDAIADAIARAAGLTGADVCPERTRALGDRSVRVHDLPWTLAATRLAEATSTTPSVRRDRLVLECGAYGSGGAGLGRGAGRMPMLRAGMAAVGQTREQRLEGTLHFVGTRRLGPDGRLDLTVPLPDHPGRWRVEAIVIADDGGGERGHAIVHTTRALQAWIDGPRAMRVGDHARGSVQVVAPGLAGNEATVSLEAGLGLTARLSSTRVRLDAAGRAEVPYDITADAPGDGTLAVRVEAGAAVDGVHRALRVLPHADVVPVATRAFVGPDAVDVHVPLPELTDEALLDVSAGPEIGRAIGAELEALRGPRWDLAAMRIDRLGSLAALARAAARLPDDAATTLLRSRVEDARAAEAAALEALVQADGSLRWWRGLPGDATSTAEALLALGDASAEARFAPVVDALAARADALVDPYGAAVAARVLARRPEARLRARGERLLAVALRAPGQDLDRLAHAALAARALETDRLERRAVRRLESALRARLGESPHASPCAGPAWFLCFGRWGERGQVARAATALSTLRHPDAAELARRSAEWLSRGAAVDHAFVWGSAAADEVELWATIGAGQRAPRFSVFVDGRRTRHVAGRVSIPAGARALVIRLPRSAGRWTQIRVDGEVRARAAGARGDLSLRRSFSREGGAWWLRVRVAPPAGSRDLEVSVPLPAGLDPAPDARPPAGGELALLDGAVRLRLPRPEGEIDVRVPLVPTGSGRFHVGAAIARTADATRWGTAPGTELEIR